ncbi:MAG: hypothetical protein VYC01_01515, partial [Nitrospinota bacterium]|nr:hypothetical protein [Nitrospinota bacterium]
GFSFIEKSRFSFKFIALSQVEYKTLYLYNKNMARLALFGIAVVFVIIVARLIFPSSSSKEPNPTEMVQDPNNGVYIPKKEAIKKTINGNEYYFSTEQSAEEYIKKNQTKTD